METSDAPEKSRSPFASQARWRENNQLAVWAHKAVQSALRRGLLVKAPCEICGDENAEYHHPDHSQPLIGNWWCRKHHKAHHAAKKRGAV